MEYFGIKLSMHPGQIMMNDKSFCFNVTTQSTAGTSVTFNDDGEVGHAKTAKVKLQIPIEDIKTMQRNDHSISQLKRVYTQESAS